MSLPKRVLRILTHINIGATLGIAAWLVWSSAAVAFAPSLKNTEGANQQPIQFRPISEPPCNCSRSQPRLQVSADDVHFAHISESAEVKR
ncbi:MAG: hypothetical protein WBK51_00900 [Polaromonas sp.]